MKRFNQGSITICIITILINLIITWGHYSYLDTHPNDSANSGIGSAILFMTRMYITYAICFVLFIITIIKAILNMDKDVSQKYTLINIGLIIFTAWTPNLFVW